MPAGGYFGRALVIDLADASAEVLPLDDDVLRGYVGGAGLGTWLMHRLAPPGVDPLGPEAPLAFCFSPLVGTPLTTSAKFAVVAKSPLTGHAERRAGLEPLRDRRQADRPRRDRRARGVRRSRRCCSSTATARGSSPPATSGACRPPRPRSALRERLGKAWRVASIGPAGERLVRYATLSHDGRHAGRGGLGAVLGSKLLKAVAVRAATKVAPADPPAVLAAARDLRARSFGPATAKYRELGTLANLLAFNALATLPTRNFQAATFAEAPRLSAEELAEARGVARNSCASCAIGCEHIYKTRRRQADARRVRERLRARADVRRLGPGRRPRGERPLRRAGPRHDLGGRHDRLGDGVRRARPDRRAVAALRRRRRAAAGARRDRRRARASARCWPRARGAAAEVVGQGSAAFAPHVKGLELPGYEPRTLQAMALGLAVNARGADHNRSGAYEADLSGRHDRLAGGDRARRRRGRDRGPRGGHGLADPVQVPARRVRGPVPRVGAAARAPSPAGTSTAPSWRRPRAGSCSPSARSTPARVDAGGRHAARPLPRGAARDGVRPQCEPHAGTGWMP